VEIDRQAGVQRIPDAVDDMRPGEQQFDQSQMQEIVRKLVRHTQRPRGQRLEMIQVLPCQLERMITEREEADRKAAEARRVATAAVVLSRAPQYARTTRGQAELFARYPFGVVSGVPAGLAPTGVVVAGPASWYGPGFDGRATASGAIFDQEAPTVAHRTLPLGTILLIHYGGRSVLALVNDRGPFVGGRVLDLSRGVAAALGTVQAGVARVTAEVLAPTG